MSNLPLATFLADPTRRNAWVRLGACRAYLRRSRRGWESRWMDCFDIGNCQVGDGLREHTGELRAVFLALEAQTERDYIYLENCGARMIDIAQRNGYRIYGYSEGFGHCLIKRLRP